LDKKREMKHVVLIAAFALMGSAAGWAGQEVWSPVALALALVLGLATAALFAYRRQQHDPASRPWRTFPIWGVLLGFLLWVAGTSLWSANDLFLYSNLELGASRIIEKSLLGVGLGLGAGLLVAAHVRRPKRRWARWIRLLLFTTYLAAFFVAAILYVLKTGVREPELYPPPDQSPYKLPWPGGVTVLCGQGNWGILTHRQSNTYAFDFPMPIGSPICASRDGTVFAVIDQNDGNANPILESDAGKVPGNGVTIRHDDGTFAVYWHIRRGGSRVRVGEHVKQGQFIAESGNVGYSTSPHLHFEVNTLDFKAGRWQSIPISFRDVSTRNGIPRMWLRYTSGNSPP
jgi:uncharacterized membrane protein YfcA